MEDRLYNMLIQRDEVTWQSIIYELIRSGELDPWNIDISLLARRYVEAIKKLHEHNFFISGKVLLASAILLKIKSDRLLTEHIANFDSQLFPQDDIDLLEEEQQAQAAMSGEVPQLLIKTPQARKRQLTLNDLMQALEKALSFDERRRLKKLEESMVIAEAKLPERKIDITKLIRDVYEKVVDLFSRKQSLTFDELVGSERKEDKIMTFIPLLHLDSQQKIDLRQDVPFGEIKINLIK